MLFDVAADAYDRFMGRYSVLLSPQLADLAGVEAGQRVLDVGCGPGALTAELVERSAPSRSSAVDPSEPFVEASARATRRRRPAGPRSTAVRGRRVRRCARAARRPLHGDPAAGRRRCARDPSGRRRRRLRVGSRRRPGAAEPVWDAARELDPGVAGEALLARHACGTSRAAVRRGRSRRRQGDGVWVERRASDVRGVVGAVHPRGRAGGCLHGRLDPERQVELRERCRAGFPAPPFVLTARAWTAIGRAA